MAKTKLIAIATTLLLSQNFAIMKVQADDTEHIDHHQHHQTSSNYQAKLQVPKQIQSQKTTNLTIKITDEQGQIVSKFQPFQTKLMHLIIVSDDLQFFNHIHPNYQGQGKFTTKTVFPFASNYTLFSDYKPENQPEQISVLKTKVTGKIKPYPVKMDWNTSKKIANTQVKLITDQEIKADTEINLTFQLLDKQNNPITDIKPYLGEKGHLVIIKSTNNLTKSDYIHAHPMAEISSGKVQFMTKFPQIGTYKLWGQFNVKGQIITADFWVNVK